MNTAEMTAGALVRMQRGELSPLQRIALVMPWVSGSACKELERVRDDVTSLLAANRHLAIALADANDEIQRLTGAKAAA